MSAEVAARPVARHLSRAELAALTRRYADEVREGRHEVVADPEERWHVRLHCDDVVDVWSVDARGY